MVMYLIIIAVCMALVIMLNWLALGWNFFSALLWVSATTGIEVIIMIALVILAGLCVPKVLYRDCKLYAVSKRELNFYHAIGLGKWKDYVLELGMLGGFSKKKVAAPNDPTYIDRFILELNKGMFVHTVSVLGAFLILLIPVPGFWSIRFPVAIVGAFLNLLPIMVLRYNKPRLLMLKTRLMRHQPKPVPAQTPSVVLTENSEGQNETK